MRPKLLSYQYPSGSSLASSFVFGKFEISQIFHKSLTSCLWLSRSAATRMIPVLFQVEAWRVHIQATTLGHCECVKKVIQK